MQHGGVLGAEEGFAPYGLQYICGLSRSTCWCTFAIAHMFGNLKNLLPAFPNIIFLCGQIMYPTRYINTNIHVYMHVNGTHVYAT